MKLEISNKLNIIVIIILMEAHSNLFVGLFASRES